MTMSRYTNAIAAKKALFDLVDQHPDRVPATLDAALSQVYETEREAIASIAATPTRSLSELAAVAALLADLVEEGAWEDEQPPLVRRVAGDLVRLAASPVALHS